MAVEVTLPELGESVEGGLLVTWLVAEGDTVTEGQAIAEVSTDKVDTEVPSPRAGTVTRLVAELQTEVAVGAVLLELEPSDTAGDTGDAASATASGTAGGIESPAVTPAPAKAPTAPSAAVAAAPAAGAPLDAEVAGMRLSPLVRQMLRESGLDPRDVVGTGPGGRITADDVVAAAGAGTARAGGPATTPARPRSAAPRPAGVPGRVEPLSRMRKVIAQRMHDSMQSTAQLTSAVEADVTRIMELRGRVRDAARAQHGVSLSPLAFIAHATVRALAMHPVLNASIDVDDSTVTYHDMVNLGIAVDAPNGLMVPVIRDAQTLGPVSLQLRIADLADRARTRRITPDDLAGGTFTITNTGSRGSLFDTPILNPPEVGILATPAIEKRPVVISDGSGMDRIAIRHRTYLCLTYDHRLIDGADAARFLTDLAALLDSDDWGPEVDALLG
jgi:pyruvate dehydrogenase E2 component (dihydrolipoamide acetyltransferase)